MLVSLLACWAICQSGFVARGHAHNDYEHTRPLHEALESGFASIEADIFLVDGKLLVGHEKKNLSPDRTLNDLYLDPLLEIHQSKGYVIAGKEPLFLLIDIKDDAKKTYEVLRVELLKVRAMLTSWQAGVKKQGSITVILTGNEPRDEVRAEQDRLAALDGRIEDLGGLDGPDLIPIISENWSTQIGWLGVGAMTPGQRQKLDEIVRKAHSQGRTVRFWASPDNEKSWRLQVEAKVDWINTDKLGELSSFLGLRRSRN